jgi:hypothetical protein
VRELKGFDGIRAAFCPRLLLIVAWIILRYKVAS